MGLIGVLASTFLVPLVIVGLDNDTFALAASVLDGSAPGFANVGLPAATFATANLAGAGLVDASLDGALFKDSGLAVTAVAAVFAVSSLVDAGFVGEGLLAAAAFGAADFFPSGLVTEAPEVGLAAVLLAEAVARLLCLLPEAAAGFNVFTATGFAAASDGALLAGACLVF